MDQIKILGKLDRVGTAFSLACAAHCLLLPLLITLLPLAGVALLEDSGIDTALIVIAVIVAVTSLCWGAKVHGHYNLLGLVLFALFLFSGAYLVEGEYLHAALMGSGGLTLASAHVLNRKLCQTCSSCDC